MHNLNVLSKFIVSSAIFMIFSKFFTIFVVVMPRHKYNSKTSKPADINAIVGAIKEVTIEKKSLRSVGQAYKIDKSKLSRYISKLTQALDPSTASNEQLVNFVSSLSGQTGEKTVCCFLI